MRVKVTAEDINLGLPGASRSCPIACAIKRQMGRTDISVGTGIVRIGTTDATLPRSAKSFIMAFDENETVVPFEFDLDVLGEEIVSNEAAQDPDADTLSFDEWESADDKFALRVSGDSMMDEQIRDGDYVIVQKTPATAVKPGQIVAVRDDDGQACLKRYYRDGHRVRLESGGKTIYRERVEILGVLVGVVRKY